MSLFGEDDTPDSNTFDHQPISPTPDNEALPINPAPLPSSVDLSQGHHRFVFPSGDEYIGDWLDSQMHGQGTLYLNVSKDVTAPTVLVSFQGTFEKGIPIEGVAEYADGSSYEGPLSNGLSNGVGVYTKGGLSITGQFLEGVPVGVVDVTYNDGQDITTYQGRLQYDKFHDDHATLIYPYNAPIKSYTGSFSENKRHGWGLLTYNIDALYEKQHKQSQEKAAGATPSGEVEGDGTTTPSSSILQTTTQEGFTYSPGTNIRLSPNYDDLNGSLIHSIYGYFIDHMLRHGIIFYTDGSVYIGEIATAGTAKQYTTTSITSLQNIKRSGPSGARPATSSSPSVSDGSILNPFSPGDSLYVRQGVGVLVIASSSITVGVWNLDLPQQPATVFYTNPTAMVSSHKDGDVHPSTSSSTPISSVEQLSAPLSTGTTVDSLIATLIKSAQTFLPVVTFPEVFPREQQANLYYNSTQEQLPQGPIIKTPTPHTILTWFKSNLGALFTTDASSSPSLLCIEGVFAGSFLHGQRIRTGLYIATSYYPDGNDTTRLAPPLIGLNNAIYAVCYGLWAEDAPNGACEALFVQNRPQSDANNADDIHHDTNTSDSLLSLSRAVDIVLQFQHHEVIDILAVAPFLKTSVVATSELSETPIAAPSSDDNSTSPSIPMGGVQPFAETPQHLSYFNGNLFCGIREHGVTVFSNNDLFFGRYTCPTEEQINKAMSRNHCRDTTSFLHADFYRNFAPYRVYINRFCAAGDADSTSSPSGTFSSLNPFIDTFSQRYLRTASSLNVVRGDSTYGDSIGSCSFGMYIYNPRVLPDGSVMPTLWIGGMNKYNQRHGKGIYCRDVDLYALLSSSYQHYQHQQQSAHQSHGGHLYGQHTSKFGFSQPHQAQSPQQIQMFQYCHSLTSFFQNYQASNALLKGAQVAGGDVSITSPLTYHLLQSISASQTRANTISETLPPGSPSSPVHERTHALQQPGSSSPSSPRQPKSSPSGLYPNFHPLHLLSQHVLLYFLKYELNNNCDTVVASFAKQLRSKSSPIARLYRHSSYLVVGEFINDITFNASLYNNQGTWQGSILCVHPMIKNEPSSQSDTPVPPATDRLSPSSGGSIYDADDSSPLATLSPVNLEATAHFICKTKHKSYTDLISITQDTQTKLAKLYRSQSPLLKPPQATSLSSTPYCATLVDCHPSSAGTFTYHCNYTYTGYALNVTWQHVIDAFAHVERTDETADTPTQHKCRLPQPVDPEHPETILTNYLSSILDIYHATQVDGYINHHETNFHRIVQVLKYLQYQPLLSSPSSSPSPSPSPTSTSTTTALTPPPSSIFTIFVDGALSQSSSPDIYVGHLVDMMPMYMLPHRSFLADACQQQFGDSGLKKVRGSDAASGDVHSQRPTSSESIGSIGSIGSMGSMGSADDHSTQTDDQQQNTLSNRILYGERPQQPLRHGKGSISAGNISKRKVVGDFELDRVIRGIETDDQGDTYIGTFDENNKRDGKYVVCLALRKWVSICYFTHGTITHGTVWYNVSEAIIKYISTQLEPIRAEEFDFNAHLIDHYSEQYYAAHEQQSSSVSKDGDEHFKEHIYDSPEDADNGPVHGYIGPEDDHPQQHIATHTHPSLDDYSDEGVIEKYYSTVNDDTDKAMEVIYEDEIVEIVHRITNGMSLDIEGSSSTAADDSTTAPPESVSDTTGGDETDDNSQQSKDVQPSTLVRVSAEGLACFDVHYQLRLSQVRSNRGWRYRLPQPDCLGQLSRWYYTGEIDDTFLPHGEGEMYWLTSTTLQQQVEILYRRDYTVINNQNPGAPASYYKGHFEHGVLHGEGTVHYHTPSDYVHVDFNMATQVSSSFLCPCASTFTGTFAHGAPHYGVITYDPASFQHGQTFQQYTGQVNELGQLHGEGSLVYASGDTFTGVFAQNYPVHGTIHFTNGTIFTGDLHTIPYSEYLLNPFYFNLLSTKQELDRLGSSSMAWSSGLSSSGAAQNPQQLECERVTYANSFNLTYSFLLQSIIQFLAYHKKPEHGLQDVPVPLAIRNLVSLFQMQTDDSQQQLKEIIASIQEYQQTQSSITLTPPSTSTDAPLHSVSPSEESDTRLCLYTIPQEQTLQENLTNYMVSICTGNTALLPPTETKVFSGRLPYDADLQERLSKFIHFITHSLTQDSVYIYLNNRLTIFSSTQVARFIGSGTITFAEGGNNNTYMDALTPMQQLCPSDAGTDSDAPACYSQKCREIIAQTMSLCFTSSLNLISQLSIRQSWPMLLLPSSVADPSQPDYFTRYPREKGKTVIHQDRHHQIGYHDAKEQLRVTVTPLEQRLDAHLIQAIDTIQEKTNQQSNEYMKGEVHAMLTELRQTEVLLENIKLTLETEEKEDTYCRKRFGDTVWTPSPSTMHTAALWSQHQAVTLQHQQHQQGSSTFLQNKTTHEYIFDMLDVNISHWEQRLWRRETLDIHRLKVLWFIHRLRFAIQRRRLQFVSLLQQLIKSDNMLLLLSYTSELSFDPSTPPDLGTLTQKMIRRLLVSAKQEYTDINHTNELIESEIQKYIGAYTSFQSNLMHLQVEEKTKIQQPLQNAVNKFNDLSNTVERITREVAATNTTLRELYAKAKEMFRVRQQERQQHSRLLLSEELQQVILTNDLRKVYALIFTCCFYQKQLEQQQKGSTLHDGTVIKASAPVLDLHRAGHLSQLSPLQLAVSRGLKSMTVLLYKLGCSLLQRTGQGKTLGLVAIENGHPEMISTLVRLGYPLNRVEQENTRSTLLHIVVSQHGNADLVKYLLYLGADVNTVNSNNQTPLMLACMQYHHFCTAKAHEIASTGNEPREVTQYYSIISSLIQFGAKLNVRDNAGNTALHHLFGSYLTNPTNVVPSVIRNAVILLVSKGARHKDGMRNHLKQPPSHPAMATEMDTTRQAFISQAEKHRFTLLPLNSSDASWQADGSTTSCTECENEFTMFNRRHHCRLCGKLFCDHCTKSSIISTTLNSLVRSCSSCYNMLSINVVAYEQHGFQSKQSQLHINMTTLMLHQDELKVLEEAFTQQPKLNAPLGASLHASVSNGFSEYDNINVDLVSTTQPMITTHSTSSTGQVSSDPLRGKTIRPQTQLTMMNIETVPLLTLPDPEEQRKLQETIDTYISITQQSQSKKLPKVDGVAGITDDDDDDVSQPKQKRQMLENEYVLIDVAKPSRDASNPSSSTPAAGNHTEDDDDDDSDDLLGDLRR